MNAEIFGFGFGRDYDFSKLPEMKYMIGELRLSGVTLAGQASIPLDGGRIVTTLQSAVARCRLIFTVGGLEPGEKGLAKAAVASMAGSAMRTDGELLREIEQYCSETGVECTQAIRSLAAMPADAMRLEGDTPLCSGFMLRYHEAVIIMLPGNPAQFIPLFMRQVLPIVSKLTGSGVVARSVRTFGLSRAQVEQRLGPLLGGSDSQCVGVYAGAADVTVRIAARAGAGNPARALESAVRAVSERLGDAVYGVDSSGMQSALVALLHSRHEQIAIGESGTGGYVSRSLNAQPHASEVFQYGVSANSERAKGQLLDVPERLLKRYGSASPQAAAAMALGALKRGGATLGLGVACDAGGKGRCFVAATDGKRVWGRVLTLNGANDRGANLRYLAAYALNLARLVCMAQPQPYEGSETVEEALSGRSGKGRAKVAAMTPGSAAPAAGTETAAADLPLGKRLYKNFIPQKGDAMPEILRKCIFFVFVAVFIGSAAYIINYYRASADNEKTYNDIKGLYSMGAETNSRPKAGYPDDYLTKFAALWERNPDIAGWINIPDTGVDYPVVQFSDNDYYLRRDFDQNSNQHGVPFMDFRVDQKKPSTNTLIYSHNMADGQMFGELEGYKNYTSSDLSGGLYYYQQHPVITYDSVYEENKYKIFGVFVTSTSPDHGEVFDYVNFVDAENEQEVIDFVNGVRERSFINTGVDVKTSDTFLTLSTCVYSFKGVKLWKDTARLVIVARKVRPGESAEVDTSKASINPDPVMPDAWYDLVKNHQSQVAAATATAISFPQSRYETTLDDPLILEVVVEPSTAKPTLTWASSDSSVLTVSNGTVQPVGIGTATVTAITENGLTATAEVSITQPVERVVLLPEEIEISSGQTYQIEAEIRPEDATYRSLSWYSSNNAVATVNADGVVTGVSGGTATITATAYNGVSGSMTVRVKQGPQMTISLSPSTLTVEQGREGQITASIANPPGGVAPALNWSVGDSKIASVSGSGTTVTVKGLKEGDTSITVSGGGVTASGTIQVRKKAVTMTLSPNPVVISQDAQATVTATLSDGSSPSITWRSSDESVATVSGSGTSAVVTGKNPGTATIIASGGGAESSVSVTVNAKAPELTLNPTSVTLNVGQTQSISASTTVTKWESSNTGVATVSGGTITAVAPGTATITATAEGGKTATVSVTVNAGQPTPSPSPTPTPTPTPTPPPAVTPTPTPTPTPPPVETPTPPPEPTPSSEPTPTPSPEETPEPPPEETPDQPPAESTPEPPPAEGGEPPAA